MNIELQNISDPIIIKKALMVDKIYKDMVTQDIEGWLPDLVNSAFFYVYKDSEPFGVITLERFCSNALVIHGGVFAAQRGINTPEVFREIIELVKQKTNKEVLTYVTANNIPCLRMMEKAGLKQKCLIPNASIKGDIIILMVE